MDGEVRLQLFEDGADAERLDVLTGYVRRDLLQLDVEDVSRTQAGNVPPGARAIDVVALGGLVVSLGRTATGLKAVVAVVRRWLSGGDGVRRTVKIVIDGDALELSEVSAAEQDRLVDLFVRRHAGEG
jgi:NAD(P)H-hydrate repair Nnr-like enzyme with NAD(P)H-hydrate dehydratase domain